MELKQRLSLLLRAMSHGLVERDTPVRLALLAALAAEHVLLIGPPGTAKSELARRLHRAFRDAAYFERLLTRFSVPEELFGPLSIAALEQDRYERQTAGFLPEATIAFIDEVFKANSAILNALLTLLNEREFDNGAQRVASPLVSVIGASNAVPEDEALAAFYDRFLVRYALAPVSEAGFVELMRLPQTAGDPPDSALALTREELADIARAAGEVELTGEVLDWLAALRAFLGEQRIYVSDRRWRKILRLLRTAAYTDGRDRVEVWDLWLLRFCAHERPEQETLVAEWFERRLGTFEALDPPRFTSVVQAFEAQLNLERNAHDLAYTDGGHLDLGADVGDAKGASYAARMTAMRVKRYGALHIRARVAEVNESLAALEAYRSRLDRFAQALDEALSSHLWIDRSFRARAAERLAATRQNVEALRDRLLAAREGFAGLPRLPADSGAVPAPVLP